MDKQSIISRIEDVNNIKFSDEQLDVLNSSGGLRIVSGAGAGKTSIITSLLLVKIMCGELDPSRVLCATFSKSGATEMKSKFDSLCGKLGVNYSVDFRTLHSLYYSILESLGYRLNVVNSIQLYVRQALKELGIAIKPNTELEEYVLNLISYQVNTATADKDLENCFIFDRSILKLQDFVGVRDLVSRLKANDGVVDFDDIQKQVYMLLYAYDGKYTNLVLDFCRSKYSYYYIDEFQDTGLIQYKILNKIVSNLDSSKLTVIGDDDQSIYIWRGTNPRLILEDVVIDYNLDTKILPMNYRCKSNIVDFASKSIVNNSKRKEKDLKSFESGGKVQLLVSRENSYFDICKSVIDTIKSLVSNGNRCSDIAVLCRNNNQMQLLNLMLYCDGFQTKHNYSMKFSESNMYSDVKSVIKMIDGSTNDKFIRNNLYKFIGYCSKENATYMSELMLKFSLSFVEVLELVLSLKCSDVKSNQSIGTKDRVQLEYFVSNISSAFLRNAYELYNILILEDNIKKLKLLFDVFKANIDFKYKGDARRRLEGFIDFILELASNHSLDILSDIEKLEESSDSFNTDKINLSTIHGSKGLEYKNVILLGCDNIVFPNRINILNMIESSGYSTSDIMDYIDSERRLYYVGCTRAKDRLYISCSKDDVCFFVLESLGFKMNNEIILDYIRNRRLSGKGVDFG